MSELTELRIGRQVGGGGTATVHLATTTGGDEVAAKVFPSTVAVDQVQREAELAERFVHPNVIRVRGVVAAGPSSALVMDWAPRGSLAELITARGTLSTGETVTVAAALAAVLVVAQDRGLVHGDLTAANVVFSAQGRPLLTDFGSARHTDDITTAVTMTPTDLAPEVARGGNPDQAADLFGLGSVLLTCLTGRPAWSAIDVRDVVVQSTVGQWPDPGPGPLADLVRDLLDESPSRRPAPTAVLARLQKLDTPQPLRFPESALGRHAAVEENEPPVGPAGWPDPGQVVTQLRRLPPEPEPESTGRSRGRVIALVAAASVVVIGLLAAAVLVWRGPAVADEVPSTAPPSSAEPGPAWSEVEVSSTGAAPVQLFSTRRPSSDAAEPLSGSTTAPTTPSEAAADPVRGGPGSGVAPAPPPDPTVVTGDLAAADWLAVVTELDSRRAHALITRDVAFLDLVYVAPSVLADADGRTIQDLTDTDRTLAGAAHVVSTVRWQSTEADGSVRLTVSDELPPYPILSAAGTKVGTTVGRGATQQVMVLQPTPEGFRIRSVTRS